MGITAVTPKSFVTHLQWGLTIYLRKKKFPKHFKCYLLEKTKNSFRLLVEFSEKVGYSLTCFKTKKFLVSINKGDEEGKHANRKPLVCLTFSYERIEAGSDRIREKGSGRVLSTDVGNIDIGYYALRNLWRKLFANHQKLPKSA